MFPHIFGQDHDNLSLDPAFDLTGIVLHQPDILHYRAHFCIQRRTFYIQGFDENNRISGLEHISITIFVQFDRRVIFMITRGFCPGKRSFFEVDHVEGVGGPAFLPQAV